MLYWDIVWKKYEHELENINSKQRADLALACLEDVLSEYQSYFDRALVCDQRDLVKLSLEGIKSGVDLLEGYSEKLEVFVDGPLPAGVWDIFMGLVHLINSRDDVTSDDALEVMSFAYQSVLDLEIISKLQTEKREDEIRLIEATNQACVRTLNKQLDLLKQLK